MKRTSFILLALAVVSLLGQGCRKSEEWPQAGADRSIAFSPAVVGLQSPVEGSKSTLYNNERADTMALSDCGLTSFKVSAWSEGNDPVVPAGTVISFAEDKWTSDTKYVWPEDATLHFYAYVPSDGLTESSISADGQVFNYSSAVVTERTDLLMGYYIGKGTAITNKVMGADICFGHPLGALVIKAGNFLKDLQVSKIRIEGLLNAGTVEQQGSDFVWTPSGNADGVYEETFESYTVSEKEEALTPVLLVIPQDLSLFPVKVTIDYTDAKGISSSYIAELSSGSFLSGTVNSYTIKKNNLVHYFSVSADKKVVFAPGNLQFRAVEEDEAGAKIDSWPNATTTAPSKEVCKKHWRFARHQWEFVGNDTTKTKLVKEYISKGYRACSNSYSNTSGTYAGWIDAFAWGTSGFFYSNSAYNNASYKNPWYYTSSTTNNSYFGLVKQNNLSVEGKSDWGWTMSDENETWYTPTIQEWYYLLSGTNTSACYAPDKWREDAADKRALAQIAVNAELTVNGLVILPDNFVFPEGLGDSRWSPAATAFDTNKYNAEEWAVMEEHGAVFLPAIGQNGQVATDCTYWSSSYYSNATTYASGLRFKISTTPAVSINGFSRNYRYPVRLVKEIKIQD